MGEVVRSDDVGRQLKESKQTTDIWSRFLELRKCEE